MNLNYENEDWVSLAAIHCDMTLVKTMSQIRIRAGDELWRRITGPVWGQINSQVRGVYSFVSTLVWEPYDENN